MSNGSENPASTPSHLTLMVVSEIPEHSTWLRAAECEQAGVSLAWIHDADIAEAHPGLGEDRAVDNGRDPDITRALNLHAITRRIAAVKPDACLLLADGTLSRLVWVLADLACLPVFVLITTEEQLDNLPRRRKPKPDLFFIGNPELLPAALEDERYGSTLLATGHPARDLGPSGPSAADARERLLGAVQQWWRGDIAPARPDLSIVVPAYRESGNLPGVCERLIETIEQHRIHAEVVLVDDGSPDDTYAVALTQMWRSPRIRPFTKGPPRGMGFAIRHGLQRARGAIAAITMGDGSDDVSRIPEMLRKVRDEGCDLAIGSRYRQRANYEAVPRLYRFWSAIFRYTTWALLGLRLRDYTNAFRVFRRSIFDRQGLEGGGFEISPEITFKAWFATGRVAEVDVKHLKRGTGQSNFSFLRAGPGYGKMLLKAVICRITGRWFVLDW